MNQTTENFDFSYTNWQAKFLQATLIGSCIFGLIAVIPAIFGSESDVLLVSIYASTYAALLITTILPAPYFMKAGTLVGLLFALGVSGLAETGIQGDARVFMLGAITMAALLFSWRAGWVITGLTITSYIVSGWLIINGIFTISSKNVNSGDFSTWASGTTSTLLLAVIIVNGIRLTQIEFENSRNTFDENEKNQGLNFLDLSNMVIREHLLK